MKLSEAIDHLVAVAPQKCLRVETTDAVRFWDKAEQLQVTLVTFGDSVVEEFASQLQDSLFGARFWESYHRGGLFIYHVPKCELVKDQEWFSLISPRAEEKVMEPFVLMAYEVEVLTKEMLSYKTKLSESLKPTQA